MFTDLRFMARTTEDRIAWISRRLMFGATAQLADIDRLVQPTEADVRGVWADVAVAREPSRGDLPEILSVWLAHMAQPSTSIAAWMTWQWHDYFAVSATKVKAIDVFTDHIHLLQRHSFGDFTQLLNDVTIDPAMLLFLDGRQNRIGAINENYGRELLELYSLGIGSYTEDDVRAAAVALTGWTLDEDGGVRFIDRRHDASPQQLLGKTVDDVPTTIAAVTSHESCAVYVASTLSNAVLGTPLSADVQQNTAEEFRRSGLNITTLMTRLLSLALDEELDVPIVLGPVQWLLQTEALTGATLDNEQRLFLLRQMGQVPGVPPNVGGYPGQETWAGPSAMIGRFRAASALAGRADEDSEALRAARANDWRALATLAHRPDGFSETTHAALDAADQQRRDGREALAAALMSPEMAVA